MAVAARPWSGNFGSDAVARPSRTEPSPRALLDPHRFHPSIFSRPMRWPVLHQLLASALAVLSALRLSVAGSFANSVLAFITQTHVKKLITSQNVVMRENHARYMLGSGLIGQPWLSDILRQTETHPGGQSLPARGASRALGRGNGQEMFRRALERPGESA